MRWLAGLIDPIGRFALDDVTRYWTLAERGTRLIPFTGTLALNRLVCVGIGAALLALAIALYRRRAARGPRCARRRSRSKTGGGRSHAPRPGCVLRRRGHLGAIHVVRATRDARHPAQLDVPGPAGAGGGRVHSRFDEPRPKVYGTPLLPMTHIVVKCAGARLPLVAAGSGGPVQHRDRMARAAGRHRRDRRRDTGAELCLSGREARGGHADGARHYWRGNGRRDCLSARQRRHPHRPPLLPCQFVRAARPADGDDRRPGDLRAGAGEPEIYRPRGHPDPGDRDPAHRRRGSRPGCRSLHFATYPRRAALGHEPVRPFSAGGILVPGVLGLRERCSSAWPRTRSGSAVFRRRCGRGCAACGRR